MDAADQLAALNVGVLQAPTVAWRRKEGVAKFFRRLVDRSLIRRRT